MATQLTVDQLPFTYSGTWDAYSYTFFGKEYFYAELLSNGTFMVKQDFTVDVFCVGGGGGGTAGNGGGGGGGGYTTSAYGLSLSQYEYFSVVIGAGGTAGTSTTLDGGKGGTTYFKDVSALGGDGSLNKGRVGGAGGSGGGGSSSSSLAGGKGGSDGGNGTSAATSGGAGQGSTTRPFGGDFPPFDSMGPYSGGGGGGYYYSNNLNPEKPQGAGGAIGGGAGGAKTGKGASGTPNTGGGGGGSGPGTYGGLGGSGLVIIRGILNLPPEIAGEDQDFGDLTETGLTYSYTVTDDQSESLSVTERLDGTVIRNYTVQNGEENTLDLTDGAWTCVLNGSHNLTITATDEMDESVTRTLTFSKNVTGLEFITKNPNPMESRPTVLALKVAGTAPATAIETYYACNNGLDDEPTWEDITTVIKNGYAHTFANTEKASENWAVRIRIQIDRGGAGDCYVSGLSYAYKTEESDAVETQIAALAARNKENDALMDALLTQVIPSLMAGGEVIS